MIVYVDSSVVARAYLSGEDGHAEARALLQDPDIGRITGTWTRIEVSGALVRAARARGEESSLLLDELDADLGPDGPITVVSAAQDKIEAIALRLVREHAIRAMDAWHLAVARITLPELSDPRESPGFASRDKAQSAIAATLGFQPM